RPPSAARFPESSRRPRLQKSVARSQLPLRSPRPRAGSSCFTLHGDKCYRGHNYPVWISGQVRRVTKAIRREMRRRAAIEPVIGHLKEDPRQTALACRSHSSSRTRRHRRPACRVVAVCYLTSASRGRGVSTSAKYVSMSAAREKWNREKVFNRSYL